MPVVALVLGIGLFVVACLVDLGRALVCLAGLQSAADAAALAGASAVYVRVEVDGRGRVYDQEAYLDEDEATSRAMSVLNLNIDDMVRGVDDISVKRKEVEIEEPFRVNVLVEADVRLQLLQAFLGIGEMRLGRRAGGEYRPQ
ncbi:MAG: pilus assembly protein TadG-related protein [Anaerolineae bacterium]